MKQLIIRITKDVLGVEPSTIELLHGGYWAKVYRVDTPKGSIAIKVHTSSGAGLNMERALMREFGALGMNVPTPLACGELDNGDGGYLVMSYARGTLLEEVWSTLSQMERKVLCYRLLDMLHAVNSVVVQGYGPLSADLSGAYPTLDEYLAYQTSKFKEEPVSQHLECKNWHSLLGDVHDAIRNYLPTDSHVVHADFRMRNLIYDDGKLTLIDFGNSLGMLPGFDFYRFVRTDRSEEMLSMKEVSLMKREYTKSSPDYPMQEPLFKALLGMQLASFLYKQGNQALIAQYLNDIVEVRQRF